MTADDYLRSVSFELRDLPWGQRQDLLTEIRTHLDELPAGTDLGARLGTPKEYAADLRAAAGLERRRGVSAFLRARRPRNLILVALVLIMIGLGIGAVEWIGSYQPLTLGNGLRYPAGARNDPAGGSFVVFHKRRPFEFGVTVLNTGRFGVRVLGVPEGVHQLFSGQPMMGPTMERNTAGMEGPYTRFHPFDLAPGQVRLLFYKGVYAHCRYWTSGSSTVWTAFPLRYSFLWKTATADIQLTPNNQLAIVFPKGFRCFSTR